MGAIDRFRHDEIEGLRAGRFKLGINTTCIVYRIGATVIDTGPPNQWRAVRRFLRERRVHQVLITHHHEDHSGNGARIQTAMGGRVLGPESGLQPMARGFPLRAYQRIIWGRPARFAAEAVPAEMPVARGLTLQALHCPGHSQDMTCYLVPERGWLFSGDLYIASRTRYLRADEDVGQQLESLRRLLEVDFETLFCAHRGFVAEGKLAVERKLTFLEELCRRVRQMQDQGIGVREITRRILGREDVLRWFTGGHFCKRNLIEGCLRVGEPQPHRGDQL